MTSIVEREALRREADIGVSHVSDMDVNRGANREHGVSRRGHGGRGHRVSPKVVRQRRASGTKPRRGHNFDHRLRNERGLSVAAAEAKAYDETQTEVVARLMARFDASGRIKDDMEQELWLRLLEGETEAQIVTALPSVRSRLNDIEMGPWGHLSLDAPMGREARHGEMSTWADIIDQDGRIAGGQAPLPSDLQKTSCIVCGELSRGLRCMACAVLARGPRGFYTRSDKRLLAIELAAAGASLRRIAAKTGLARNTVSRIVGPRPEWGVVRQPSVHRSCHRCGYSPSSHASSSKARRAGNLRVCSTPVLHCACGGWRSVYSENRCARCRALGVWKRRAA